MFIGQILTYRYNGKHNAVEGIPRNIFQMTDVSEPTKERFQDCILDALDGIIPGTGYVLVKWGGRLFQCEKDTNNPNIPYVRHELKWHPLKDQFTV